MSRPVAKNSVDVSTVLRFVDSITGAPETGVTEATSGLELWYRREGGDKVIFAPAALAGLDAAHVDGGIEHISDGYCRIDVPDDAWESGANGVMIGGSATGMVVIAADHPLTNGLSGLVGPGATAHTITIKDVSENPLSNVDVWITTDIQGTDVVAGALQTADDGTVTFMLDSGVTYYMWRKKFGYNFTQPMAFQVA